MPILDRTLFEIRPSNRNATVVSLDLEQDTGFVLKEDI